MNDTIAALHTKLIKMANALSVKLSKATDADEAESLLTEIEEVNHRVVVAGRLLFHASTQDIDNQLAAVAGACDELTKSIKEIKAITKVIKDVGKFLTLVDKGLDLLKLVP
jgi:hypothetical protein